VLKIGLFGPQSLWWNPEFVLQSARLSRERCEPVHCPVNTCPVNLIIISCPEADLFSLNSLNIQSCHPNSSIDSMYTCSCLPYRADTHRRPLITTTLLPRSCCYCDHASTPRAWLLPCRPRPKTRDCCSIIIIFTIVFFSEQTGLLYWIVELHVVVTDAHDLF